jgi:prolyl-tRNA synthetase
MSNCPEPLKVVYSLYSSQNQGGMMRFSQLFGRTLREDPADAEMISHRLLLRAGLIRPLASGIYSYLPLGWRALQKIESIVREEMDAIGGQEMLMPVVHPAEIWRATGRYDSPAPGPALVRFQDRTGHDMVLAMTHEETAAYLAREEIHSYRQLPALIYQVQTKFRDEPRSRGGLVRLREFMMKDAYSFDADADGLAEQYERVYGAYEAIFRRCGLETVAVEAYTGIMGGQRSHEFMALNESGEDTLILCPGCRYAANAEAARIDKGVVETAEPLPVERVATPGTQTIEALAALLDVERRQTLKAVFYTTPSDEIIFAAIRGDLDVNESKLSALLGGVELQPARVEALTAAGIVAGYASPVGVSRGRVVVDDSVPQGNNYVAGANEPGYHLLNVNYGRDFTADIVGDIALAREGDTCPHCGHRLTVERGIELGHVFQLGTRYSEALGATYLDRDGVAHPLVMGSYGIGLGRLLACIIEQHHDEKGIVWPVSVAPFDVYIVVLGGRDPAVAEAAEGLYTRLRTSGYEVILDDRAESAGVKFNDADLLGIPVRLTLSGRTLRERSVEIKARWDSEAQLIPQYEVDGAIRAVLAQT